MWFPSIPTRPQRQLLTIWLRGRYNSGGAIWFIPRAWVAPNMFKLGRMFTPVWTRRRSTFSQMTATVATRTFAAFGRSQRSEVGTDPAEFLYTLNSGYAAKSNARSARKIKFGERGPDAHVYRIFSRTGRFGTSGIKLARRNIFAVQFESK